jgi:hypothetical protein
MAIAASSIWLAQWRLYQISSMMVALDRTPLPRGTEPFFQ